MKIRNYFKLNHTKNGANPFILQHNRIKEGNIDPLYRADWSEGVFILDNKEKERLGNSFNKRVLFYIVIVVFLLISFLIGKIAWLQIVNGDYYHQIAEGNRIRIKRVEPKRGVIYDHNMQALVRNKPNFVLYVVPADLPKQDEKISGQDIGYLDEIVHDISGVLKDMTSDDLYEILATVSLGSLEAYRPLFITDNIEYERAMELYLLTANWPGVVLSNTPQRDYSGVVEYTGNNQRYGLSTSHILGYTGKINANELEKYGKEYLSIDYIGKMGIEYFWENELKGSNGKKQIEVDALGKEKKIISQVDAEDGHNLVLSLDLEMQIELEKIVKKYLNKANLSRGSAVVLDPNNGEVLSMVSLPTYDNSLFARGISSKEYGDLITQNDKPLFNRAISGEFPSGSTFKPIVAVAALQERVVSEQTSFLSTGGIRIGQWFFPDWLSGGHGRTNVKKAISQSVNTFFYYIGGGYEDFTGLGVDRIVKYGEFFGLGSQTGIDLAGEADGFLPTREWKKEKKGERWYIGDTYHLAIGQGDLLVTPLQVALFTSVFANGGTLYRPHFVKNILDADDKLINEIGDLKVRSDFIDDYNMQIVREGMRQTVTNGSGRRLNTLSETSAGKTGTAQWSTKKDPHAWYIGFAPYENPKISFAFLVEEGQEGSKMTVSIAHDFLEWYFENKLNK